MEDAAEQLCRAGSTNDVAALRQGLTIVPISAQLELTLPLPALLKLTVSPPI